MGIAKDILPTIFEAFERAETSTVTGTYGAGLGLTISKHLLDLMGGTITCESVKGEGSTFTVSLPLKQASKEEKTESQDQSVMIAHPDTNTAHDSLHGRRILLVEDIEINRLLAETILKDAGFEVESGIDGCDAVEAVKKAPEFYYDLILMDIQMPVMNGYEATRVIRLLDRADVATLPIVALSANASDNDKAKSIESGMNSHIAKPFDVSSLIKTIKDHIRTARNE